MCELLLTRREGTLLVFMLYGRENTAFGKNLKRKHKRYILIVVYSTDILIIFPVSISVRIIKRYILIVVYSTDILIIFPVSISVRIIPEYRIQGDTDGDLSSQR